MNRPTILRLGQIDDPSVFDVAARIYPIALGPGAKAVADRDRGPPGDLFVAHGLVAPSTTPS